MSHNYFKNSGVLNGFPKARIVLFKESLSRLLVQAGEGEHERFCLELLNRCLVLCDCFSCIVISLTFSGESEIEGKIGVTSSRSVEESVR